MENIQDKALFLREKLSNFKKSYPFLQSKEDHYAFTGLALKANLYKSPSISLMENDLQKIMVDGAYDGGVDALLLDPNSETSDLVICQGKYYTTISYEDIKASIEKMISFYKDMQNGVYGSINERVQNLFQTLNAEVGDESKVRFVIYTSAPKNRIREDRISKILKDHFTDTSKYELEVYFDSDLIEEIKEAESRRPTVEEGVLFIDQANKALYYNDDSSAIVNISATSLKKLYSKHSVNLFSRNLRYYIRKKDIDEAIFKTISDSPETFWYKNNGLTIICDDFEIDGKELKLFNFSIVNGGQTTYLLWKNDEITIDNDFFLHCKVIKNLGTNEDEKNKFSLEIAKATNSQKAIKNIDLKSNSPEQIRFTQAMRDVGVFYQTKRGEKVPPSFTEKYQTADLADVGKLALGAIFQLPATSRNKPASLYNDNFYNPIFTSNQIQIAKMMKDLLYIDHYFRSAFLYKFEKEYANQAILNFAHNSRTICIAFTSLAARINNGNIDSEKITKVFSHINHDRGYDDHIYFIFKDIGLLNGIFNPKLFHEDKDKIDKGLYELFSVIITEGYKQFASAKRYEPNTNESNFLKKDNNYLLILEASWNDLVKKINEQKGLFI